MPSFRSVAKPKKKIRHHNRLKREKKSGTATTVVLQAAMAKVSLSGGFMESFMTLNIINFADVTKRENDGVLWNMSRVSSP